jgi:Uma2 family endonuclease
MDTVMTRPPRTIMELYEMLPDGTHAEIIDGALYMSPTPVSKHQIVSMNLSVEIGSYLKKAKLGKLFAAPFDVYLDSTSNAVQPDLIVVLNENQSIIKEHIHGVPDLLIEILSPGSVKMDTVLKKELYERFGVQEYWIINPETGFATGFKLVAGQYHELATFQNKIQSFLLEKEFSFSD